MMPPQIVSFEHTTWPNCAVELLSYAEAAPEFPSQHGSAFFVEREQRVFLVTAGHCLVPVASSNQDFLAKATDVATRLMIPIKSQTEARILKEEDYIRFSSVGYATINNDSGEFFGTGKEGHLDVAVLEVNPNQADVVELLRLRSVKLPPTGEWFARTMKTALEMEINAPLIASGFPKQGTESSIDHEAKRVVTQGVHLAGNYCGPGPYPHTHTLKLKQGTTRYEPNGMSGGPIYMRTRNGENPPHVLAGMALRGGHGTDLIHFCTVEWLTKTIDSIE